MTKAFPSRRSRLLIAAAVAGAVPSIAAGADLRWVGTPANTWDIGTTSNWKVLSTEATTTYSQSGSVGDNVTFDDRGAAGVVLNVVVSPASVTFVNFGNSYSLTGTGKLSGTGGLEKDGFGLLTVSNTAANDYSGGTVVNYGQFRPGTGALPAAGAVTLNDGQIDLNALTFNLSGDVTVNGGMLSHGTVSKSGNDFVVSSGLIDATLTGSAGLTKDNAGTVILAANDSYANTTINAGVLQVGNFAASGAVTGNVADNGTLRFARSDDVTFAGVVSGSGALDQTGAGTLTLTANNSFAGKASVEQGALTLDYTSQNGNKISATAPLVLTGGDVNVIGNAGAAFTQSVSNLTLNAGVSHVSDVGGLTSLSFGSSITRNSGGVVVFSNTGGGLRTTKSLSNGILGGWALWGTGDWATTSGGVIGPVTSYVTQDSVPAWGANQVITDAGGGFTGQLGSDLTIAALRFNAAANSTVSIASTTDASGNVSGKTLTLASGGILVTPAVGAHDVTISGGRLASGTNGELIVNQNNTAGTLTIASTPTYANLTKTGAGTAILNATDSTTGSGTWNVLEGTLAFGASYPTRSARTFFVAPGATLDVSATSTALGSTGELDGAGTIAGPISIQGKVRPGLPGQTGNLTFSGTIQADNSGNQAFDPVSSRYYWDINNAGGTAGGASGWDLITAADVKPTSTSAPKAAGGMFFEASSDGQFVQNFNPRLSYSWPVFTNTAGTALPALTIDSVALKNPTRGVFTTANSADGKSVDLVYTPLTTNDMKVAADGLFGALDLTQSSLAAVKQEYQTGQYEAALSDYRDLFLNHLATLGGIDGSGTVVTDAGAKLAVLQSRTSVTQETLIAQSDMTTYFLAPIKGAVDTDLAAAKQDADALEFARGLNWSAGTPWFGGASAMNVMANLAPGTKDKGTGGSVENQLLSSAKTLVLDTLVYSDFKNATVPYSDPGNVWGLSYWQFKGQKTFRDPYGKVFASASFHSDGTGLEQADYQRFIAGDAYAMKQAIPNAQWLDDYISSTAIPNARYVFMIQYPTNGRIGLGTQPPLPGSGDGTGYRQDIVPSGQTQGVGTLLGDAFLKDLAAYCANPASTTFRPAFTSFTYPDGGYTIQQSDWTSNATWTFLNNRNNLLPSGHVDGSSNAIQFSAFKRPLLIDYSLGNAIDSYQLNTIGVDGASQAQVSMIRSQVPNRAPLPNRFHASSSAQGIDFSEGSYNAGYQKLDWNYTTGLEVASGGVIATDVTHQRQVNFFKELGVDLVVDRLSANAGTTHQYSVNWNFPRYFAQSDIVVDNAGQRIYTQSASGANLYIRNFGTTVSDTLYYGQSHIAGSVGPSRRGLIEGTGNFYDTNLNDDVPYGSASGVWSGAGNQVLLSLLTPTANTADPVASSATRNTSSTAGMDATLGSGALVSADVAKTGITGISNWQFGTTAESLVLSSTDGKANVRGMALNSTNFTYGGTDLRSQIPVRDFEFTLRTSDKTVTSWSEVSTPIDFQWQGGASTSATHIAYGDFGTPWNPTTGGAFNAGSNWYGGVAPSAGVGANFNIRLASSATITLPVAVTVGGLNFDNPLASYTVGSASGPAITLDNSPAGVAAAVTNRGGDHTVAAPLVLTGGKVALYSSDTTGLLQITGNVSGTGDLYKSGPGTISLSGSNSFTGRDYVLGGVLQVNGDAALGASADDVWFGATDATLRFSASTTSSRTFVAAGPDFLHKVDVSPGVTATLNNGISQGGITKIGSGTLILGNCDPGGAGNITVSAGTLQMGNGGTTGSWAGVYTNDSVLAFNRSDAFTVANVINGAGDVRFLGSGTMTLASSLTGATSLFMDGSGTLKPTSTSTANNYTGDVYCDNGTIEFQAPANLGSNTASQFIHFQGGALKFTGTGAQAPNQPLDVTAAGGTLAVAVVTPASDRLSYNNASMLTGAGTLNVTGNGAAWLDAPGTDETGFTGTLNVAGTDPAGSVGLWSNSLSKATVNVSSGSTLATTGTVTLGALTGSGTVGTLINQPSGPLIVGDNRTTPFTFSGTFQNATVGGVLGRVDSFTKAGTSTMIMGSTTNGGGAFDVTVSGGTLRMGAAGAFPSGRSLTVNAAATFDLNGFSLSPAQLAGAGTVLLSGGTMTVSSSSSSTFAGAIGGSAGTLAKAGSGTLTLTGNAFPSPTAVDLNVTGGLLQSNTPLVTAGGDVTVSGSASSLRLAAPPTARTAAGYTTAGQFSTLTTASGGTAAVALADRSSYKASVLVTDALSINSATVDLGNSDMVIKGGAANLSAIQALAHAGSLFASASQSSSARYIPYTTLAVFQNKSDSGSPIFTSFDGVANLTTSDVIVKYTYIGDTNLDGKLDNADYQRVNQGYNTARSGWTWGDVDNSGGPVSSSDLQSFTNAYNWYTSQGNPIVLDDGQAHTILPEPEAVPLLAAAALALRRRRRKPA